MTPSVARDEAIRVFSSIREAMAREDDGGWLRGIDAVLGLLQAEPDPMRALTDAFTTYQSMMGGAGSFSDYFLWRDEPGDRALVNTNFDRLRSRGWEILLAAKTKELGEL